MKRIICLTAVIIFIGAALGAGRLGATPLLSMQAAEKCDSCHVMPNRSDPKWSEANYKLYQRKCGLSCGVCHVNPSGGMLRKAAGFEFGTKTLPLLPTIDEDLQRAIEVVKDNRFLTFGGDFRFLDIITNQEDKKSPFFFPMQGDLYAEARLAKYVSFLMQYGLERGGNAAVREAFGMVDNLPFNSYVKLGKFIPPYGHRLEDHTAYIRHELYFDHSLPAAYASGIEVGAEPLTGFVRASYFNVDMPPRLNTDKSTYGFSATAGWHGLWLQLGASVLDVWDYEVTATTETERLAYGVFGDIRLGRFNYLFEFDARKDTTEGDGVDLETDAFITFNELSCRLMKGLTVKARYETFDPDIDVDEDEKIRYTAGLDFYPYPMTELNFQYRYNDTPEEEYGQVVVVIHLWF